MYIPKLWQGALTLVAALTWFGGCGPGGTGTTGSSSSSTGSGSNGAGVCSATCDNSCTKDQDCNMSAGELCCDYGAAGKVCQAAATCPHACTADSNCNLSSGQACIRTTLTSTQMVCGQPSQGLKICQHDADCPSNEVCCGDYTQPFCTPAARCPKSCTTSSQCQTTQGEICCTSAKTMEPSLSAAGLCLNPNYTACPQSCSTSADCATGTTNNLLCCNGICAATCPNRCQQSSDCINQICCKSARLNAAQPPQTFSAGPSCQGTPTYATCTSCGTSTGSCTYCPGCTAASGTTGTCLGTPNYTDCASCGTALGCSYCPGCSTSTTGSCGGSALYSCGTYNFSGNQTQCQAIGCTWSSTGSPAYCSGFPSSCSSLADMTSCGYAGCSWSTGCTGTLTPCSQLTSSTACQTQYGCLWSTGTTSCTGTVTPCAQLTSTTCTSQPGCIYQ